MLIVERLERTSDSLRQARANRRQKLVHYFVDISETLQQSADKVEKNITPVTEFSKLKGLALHLPHITGRELGKEDSANLCSDLIVALDKAAKTSNVTDLRVAAGKFENLAGIIDLKSSQSQRLSRRNMLWVVPSAFVGGAAITIGADQLFSSKPPSQITPLPSDDALPVVEWDITSTFSSSVQGTIVWSVPDRLSEKVLSMTNGNFRINVQRTGSTLDILRKVSDPGQKPECGFAGVYYVEREYFPLFFRFAIPFGLNPQEQTAYLHYRQSKNGWLSYYQEPSSPPPSQSQSVYQDLGFNIIPLPVCATGGQAGGWFNKEIELSDLENPSNYMRIPALGGRVMKRFGIKLDTEYPTEVTVDKAVDYLGTGDFLGVEWIGPHDDSIIKLPEKSDICYWPGWWEPSTTFDLQVNMYAWENLPSHYKEILKHACATTYQETLSEYTWKNSEALKTLADKGTRFLQFPRSIIDRAKTETDKELEDLYERIPLFKDVYDDWSEFKLKIRSWSDKTIIPE